MKKVPAFFITRLLSVIPVLFGVSLIAFCLTFFAPGDPAELVLEQGGISFPTSQQVSALREQLGLNKSWYEQYAFWLGRTIHGDLGISYRTSNDVLAEMQLRFPVTLQLALLSLLSAGLGGLTLGLLSVWKKGKWLDHVIGFFFDFLLSLPNFLMALLLILVVAEILHILPTSGAESLQGYFLPALALSFPTMAIIGRFIKIKLLEELGKTYCHVAMARGIAEKKIIFLYALPNAILPVFALLGNFFGSVLGGSVVIESVFALPGLGSLALEAIKFRDYPLLQGYVLITGFAFVMVSLLVDLLLYYFNPKIKFEDPT